ncbi:MAG: hypothetical protein U1E11_11595 [Dethiobacteria bacterium]|nr:hypothetical protein [Dethiobacteria bacterium]
MKKYCLLIILVLLLPALMLTGCGTDDSADHYILEDAPGVMITAAALEIILANSEPYTLTYTVRTS